MTKISHHIPQKLKGEERLFSIPAINLHFSKKGVIYNGCVTAISALIGKITNEWVFIVLFIISNLVAYPIAHMTIPQSKFEGGGVPLDTYVLRKIRFKYFKKNLYIRKRGR